MTGCRLRDGGATHAVEVTGALHANNADALHAAALGGLGLAILPTWLVGQDVERGALPVVFPGYQVSPSALDTSIYAVFPYSRHLSPKVRALVDFLVRRFSPRPAGSSPATPPQRRDAQQRPNRVPLGGCSQRGGCAGWPEDDRRQGRRWWP